MAFVTASWNPLGEAFYRKVELYEMCWSIRDGLRDSLVAAAPYGGPIALLREPLRRSPSSRPQLEIYSASGAAIASFPWKSGPVVQLGWSISDELLCVQEDGSVLIYDLFGSFKRHFSMGQEVVQSQVLEAKVFHSPYGTGIAIVTGSSRFTLATNIEDLKLRRLPEVPGLQGRPASWVVLTQDRQTKVLLSIGPELYILDNTSCTAVCPPGLSPHAGSIVHMSVSFSYKYLSLFTDSGHLWAGLSNLQDKLLEFDTKTTERPKQMLWCRRPKSQQPSVVLMWDRLLLVVGECNDTIQFPVEDPSVLVGEMDGVRIINSTNQELLQEVPLVCQDIFKIASMAPGALLLEAHREYEKSSQKADEYLREIKEQNVLEEAVRQCVEAAAHEYDPATQKSLMRAASFGKCFLTDFCSDPFVSTCRELRVLNAVRESGVGMPLTHTQFKQMTLQVLIDRLLFRQFYPLAIEICRYLKIPDYQGVSRVLKHWASCKVQQKDLSDEAIARAVCVKVGESPGVSYSHIAAKAYECGRTELAIKLLDFEPRSGEQVPLLLKMKRSHLALSKAVESGDTDLVYMVVTHLKNEMNRGDFFMTLRNQPVALSLYRQFCKLQEQETLKDLYNQDDNHQELANYYVTASYREKSSPVFSPVLLTCVSHLWFSPLFSPVVLTCGPHLCFHLRSSPAVLTCGSHLCFHLWSSPVVLTFGSHLCFHLWFSPVVLTCGPHLRSSPAVLTCGPHLRSSPVVLTCGPHLCFHLWFSPVVLTCGPHLWPSPVFSPVVLTCGPHLWSSPVVLTCGSHLWPSPVALTCGPHLRSSPVVLTCGPHLRSSPVVLTCVLTCVLICVLTCVFTCGPHLWSSPVFSPVVLTCGPHLCSSPVVSPVFSPAVLTCVSHLRSSPVFTPVVLTFVLTCGPHLWSSPVALTCVFTCGSHLWFSPVVLTCGPHLWPSPVFSPAVLTCGPHLCFHLWFSPVVLTCGPHLWFSPVFSSVFSPVFSPAVLTCGPHLCFHLWFSPVVLTCAPHLWFHLCSHLRSSPVFLTCGLHLCSHLWFSPLFSPVVLTCGPHLWSSPVFSPVVLTCVLICVPHLCSHLWS
ncbi:vacuolar protein sorting-associated protein 16 homolog isoform X1 [Oryzias latipes]|uniref:vacuolar protein sorting-associated protein 16 homolog isoform X1 n=1 Tax=Oryzias latipes TaxID=8090 RepID=UPI000CE20F63|nr:vacuolar protein sorting-associated protein 16 homolog isoform X1 [Oryzias latipes]